MFKKIKKILPIIALLLFILLIYLPVFYGFFQQDEWLVLGKFIGAKIGFLDLAKFFMPTPGHWVPLTQIVAYLAVQFFRLNYPFYALLSLSLHLIVVYLVFVLAKELVKNKDLALLAALLFGVGSAGIQATSWVVADINTHGAVIFALVSLILFFKFLENKNQKVFWLSLISLMASLLFKEIALLGFLTLLVAFYIFSDKELKIKRFYPLAILIIGIFYVGFRGAAGTQVVTDSQPVKFIIYNLGTFPIKGLVETILPPNLILNISKIITSFLPKTLVGNIETTGYDLFVQNVISQSLTIILFILILIIFFLIWVKNKKDILGKATLFCFSFIILNSFVYALSPGRQGIIATLDSRNLYFISVGTSIFLSVLVFIIAKKNIIRTLILVSPLVLLNIFLLHSDLTVLSPDGNLRKTILTQIRNSYPTLSPKTIFYTESDKAYYGLGAQNRIMPFQSGFGQTLLVWYTPRQNFSKEFFENKFLWDIKSQGYKEVDGRGFGYFRDFKLMMDSMAENYVTSASVVAFRFNSKNSKIEDMTDEVRGRVEGYLSKKKEIILKRQDFISLPNSKDAGYLIDGRRETIWDSKLAYSNPQNIAIDFGGQHRVAEIDIDPYNNQDQNEVGYSILVSDDGKDWTQVFREDRFEQKEGIFKLYFKPSRVRFVKIEQIGKHKFASWVIGDLKMYEAID